MDGQNDIQAGQSGQGGQAGNAVNLLNAGNNGNGNNGSGALEIPEKFRVAKEDGSIDHDATMQKMLESYSNLEKRIGTGDLPPKTETEYKLDYSSFPEGIKIDPEREKSFLKSCHAMGMTNKQVQGVMDRYAELIAEGLQMQTNQKQAEEEALKKEWGDDFDVNIKFAQKAFLAYADEQDKANIDQIGNNTALLRILTKIGKDMEEDTFVKGDGASSPESLDALMRSEPYWNDKHPEHKATVQKVKEFYKKKYAA